MVDSTIGEDDWSSGDRFENNLMFVVVENQAFWFMCCVLVWELTW